MAKHLHPSLLNENASRYKAVKLKRLYRMGGQRIQSKVPRGPPWVRKERGEEPSGLGKVLPARHTAGGPCGAPSQSGQAQVDILWKRIDKYEDWLDDPDFSLMVEVE